MPGVELHRGGFDPSAHRPIDDAHPVEHVQAAGVYSDRTGLVGGVCQLVDHPDADAAAGEFSSGDQADRSRADN